MSAVKVLIREAMIGTGLGVVGGVVWKVAIAAPTNRTYKTYYKNLEATDASSASASPENAEILEKMEKVIATLEGGADEGGEEEE
ncbi:hypothetical protein NSK_001536 [Nannochloropsis salina CCMP1776]|uniref:Uncharacterized protein n=1 Tax=Nannochloropsis salina CCMP1776 TaxID=1027361 RepID=A0A4D9D862_9STRA|nr:hypothetical protein NSK_001536 [Nannochloropsis salina CCMP1776]|eukprot:TFJ87204.1 hypothetical protein NSK_001536 [Nannochloropsis salina CCMP1776]